MLTKDLATTIGIAIVGVLLSYFACSIFLDSNLESYSVKTVGTSVSTNMAEPNPEIFNYDALNPTVEVYVGDCTNGNCEVSIEQNNIEIIDDTESSVGQGTP